MVKVKDRQAADQCSIFTNLIINDAIKQYSLSTIGKYHAYLLHICHLSIIGFHASRIYKPLVIVNSPSMVAMCFILYIVFVFDITTQYIYILYTLFTFPEENAVKMRSAPLHPIKRKRRVVRLSICLYKYS